jgi:hypothetical protein
MYKFFNGGSFLAFTTSIFISIFNSSFMVAQTIEIKSSSEHLISLKFPESPEGTVKNPESTIGAARRGGQPFPELMCIQDQKPLTVVMHNNNLKTISSKPTFFVYLPLTKAKSAQFMLVDRQSGSLIDKQLIPLKKDHTQRIVKINLSPEANLQENQEYFWQISLICDGLIISEETYQKGIIERVLNREIESQLANTNDALEKARIYADQGIWLDTLSTLASVRDSQLEEWRELLKSIGLEDFSDRPLIDVSEAEN